jgi:hypothetical protein
VLLIETIMGQSLSIGGDTIEKSDSCISIVGSEYNLMSITAYLQSQAGAYEGEVYLA